MTNKKEWLSSCAGRYIEKSKCSPALAMDMVEASLENLNGDLTEDPIDVADEDMSCWSD